MIRRAAGCFFLVLSLLMCSTLAFAQTLTDERAWATFTLQGRAGEGSAWRWSAETLVRSREGVSTVDTVLVRPSVGFDLTPRSTAWLGYANSSNFPATGGTVTEHRVFQQYSWTARGAAIGIALRTRFEQRFAEGNNGVAFRVRQQVRLTRPLSPTSRFSIVGWEELLVHANETTRWTRGLDQNRVFAGFGCAFTPHSRVEVGYLNQFQRSRTGPDRMNHVLFTGLSVTRS
jgi:hypothetical protein